MSLGSRRHPDSDVPDTYYSHQYGEARPETRVCPVPRRGVGKHPVPLGRDKPDEVRRAAGHDSDQRGDSVLRVLGKGLARGVVLEDGGPEVLVGQGPPEQPLARDREEVGSGDRPRDGRPARDPNPDNREDDEHAPKNAVEATLRGTASNRVSLDDLIDALKPLSHGLGVSRGIIILSD